MLPDVHRMRASGDFTATVRRGVRVPRPCLVLHARHTEAPSRVGLVVSKTVGNAVVRNRVKRRLRHSLREVVVDPSEGVRTPNLAVVVRALPSSAEASYTDLQREATSAWQQAGKKLLARAGEVKR